MRTKILSIVFVFFDFFLLTIILSTCSSVQTKTSPEYKGIDPRVSNLVNEYKALAKIEEIKFTNNVTVGFKDIKEDGIVALCTYGYGWREIDINNKYWDQYDSISRTEFLFHELSHCYCGRRHDFDDGTPYPSVEEIEDQVRKGHLDRSKGYFNDGCPNSIMYPIVLSRECFTMHYGDYTHEMFNRCIPF